MSATLFVIYSMVIFSLGFGAGLWWYTMASANQDENVNYQRAPIYDRRVHHGDDFSGDAWVRWVAVGHHPLNGNGENS